MLALADAVAANVGRPRAGRLFRFHRTARRLTQRMDQVVATAWMNALARFQGGISDKALRTALASRDLAAAQAAVAASGFGRMMRDLEDPLARTAVAAGDASAQVLSAGGFGMQFNASHPNVILFARDRSAELVKGVTETAREAVRTVIALGAQEGLTVVQQARAIREVVGLPPNWTAAPHRLAQELRAGHAEAAAARRLSAVDKARIRSRIAAGTVDDKFVEEIRTRYTASLINRRALNIARSETIRAVNFGQQESWQQATRSGVLPTQSRRFWFPTPTPTLCPRCAQIPDMNPKGVRLDQPFDTPFGPIMYPPAHTDCRCGMGLGVPPGARRAAPPVGRRAPVTPLEKVAAPGRGAELPVEQLAAEQARVSGIDPRVLQISDAELHAGATKFSGGRTGAAVAEYKQGRIILYRRAFRTAEQVRSTVAHEATHLKFATAAHRDRTLVKDILRDYDLLHKEDGVTAYSRAHWNAAPYYKPMGTPTRGGFFYTLPVEETLAEIQAEAVAGRVVGSARFRALLDRVEKAYAKKPGKAYVAPGYRRTLRREIAAAPVPKPVPGAPGSAVGQPFSPANHAAIDVYARGEGALAINAELRGIPYVSQFTKADVKKLIAQLDDAFTKVPPAVRARTVWRGAHLPLMREGQIVIDKGFTSTTARRAVIQRFLGEAVARKGTIPTVLKIRLPAGSYSMEMLAPGKFAGEAESLLPRGTAFRVNKVRQLTARAYEKEIGPLTKGLKAQLGETGTISFVEVEPIVPPIAADIPGLLSAGGLPPVVSPLPAPLTLESFTERAAAREFRNLGQVADELKKLVPEADIASIEFSSAEASQAGSYGFFDPATRTIHLSRDASERLVAFWQGDRDVRAVNALRTLVHEYIHSTSPMLRAGKMGEWWPFVEEGIVESRAHAATLRFLYGSGEVPEAVLRSFTSYTTEVKALGWVEKQFGKDFIEQLWATPESTGRTKLLSAKVRGWLEDVLPKRGFTVRETNAVLSDLGDDAWHILRVGDQVRLPQMTRKDLQTLFNEQYDVKFKAPRVKQVATAFDRPPLPPTERAARALRTHKPATAAKQRAGDAQQLAIARTGRGKLTPDNEPVDVVLTDVKGRTVGVEVKTFLDQVNDKVTMHPDSLARKQSWARQAKARLATIVVDMRDQFGYRFLYSGKRYYVRLGAGSFRLGTMQGFKSLAAAMRFIQEAGAL